MTVQIPILFDGTGGSPEIQTLRLSEEAPRFLKRFGPSNLIVDQVPDFINRDHETFRRFIEAYYEWLEQYQNAYGIIDLFPDETDIDKNIGVFFSEFRQMYLDGFPSQLAFDSSGNVVSEANFLKNARSFYGAKGTEKSFSFLFRLIYNVVSEIGYPGKDILKTSHGKWKEPKSVRTTNTGNTLDTALIGNIVYQIDSLSGDISASAKVTDIIQYNRSHFSVNEMFLENIRGEFLKDKTLYCDESPTFNEIPYGLVSDVLVIDGGTGYNILDPISVTGGTDGIGFKCVIDVINKNGTIKSVKIIDPGVGYNTTFNMTVLSNSGSGTARLVPVIGGLANYAGFYSGNDGKLSSNKRLFDADYYQDFSYVLKSEIHVSKYKEIYRTLVHPAGFKMFGQILVKRDLIDSLPFHSELQRYEIPYIGHYTPYRMGTTADLYSKYASGFNPRGTTYSTYQNYGQTGGKLFVSPIGFTFGSGITWDSIAASGAAGNLIGADIFSYERLGDTLAVLLLKTIDFDLLTAAVTGAGFVEGITFTMFNDAAVGYTATIQRVRHGVGIVPENDGNSHDTQGAPLGSSLGVEGYIEAQGFSYAYWGIYHHPNTRGIYGLTAPWNGQTGAGASFGAVALKPFFKMPIGYHFHSNPVGTSYYGTTGPNNEYGLIESTTIDSPNF
jgi:hypothetical protein